MIGGQEPIGNQLDLRFPNVLMNDFVICCGHIVMLSVALQCLIGSPQKPLLGQPRLATHSIASQNALEPSEISSGTSGLPCTVWSVLN